MVGKQKCVKIRRPCRTSEIKIWGVDETANKVDVVKAMEAKWGRILSKHQLDNTTVGQTRPYRNGLMANGLSQMF